MLHGVVPERRELVYVVVLDKLGHVLQGLQLVRFGQFPGEVRGHAGDALDVLHGVLVLALLVQVAEVAAHGAEGAHRLEELNPGEGEVLAHLLQRLHGLVAGYHVVMGLLQGAVLLGVLVVEDVAARDVHVGEHLLPALRKGLRVADERPAGLALGWVILGHGFEPPKVLNTEY